MIDYGCAVVCVMALEAVCHCRCGGVNHGKGKREFAGYFCEDCGMAFGISPRGVWDRGAFVGCGTSEKYRGRFVNNTIALWCKPCYVRRSPKEAARLEQAFGWH